MRLKWLCNIQLWKGKSNNKKAKSSTGRKSAVSSCNRLQQICRKRSRNVMSALMKFLYLYELPVAEEFPEQDVDWRVIYAWHYAWHFKIWLQKYEFLIKMQKLIWEPYFPTCSAHASNKNILQYLNFRYFWSSDS